jgi:ankyrin repeat protein
MYAPETLEGKKLIGHELTHVVQQNQLMGSALVQRATPGDGEGAGDEVAPGVDAIVAAIERGDKGEVRKLLRQGISVDALDPEGLPIITVAGDAQQDEIVALLAEKGANLEIREDTINGLTPLVSAAWKGHLSVVRVLLKRGANPNNTDKMGETPLWRAAFAGHLDVIQELVKAGADPLAADEFGYDALMRAASGCQLAVVSWLLGQGADPTRSAHFGGDLGRLTALDAAEKRKADVEMKLEEAQSFQLETGERIETASIAQTGANCDAVRKLLSSR